jgi:hypothetical protein
MKRVIWSLIGAFAGLLAFQLLTLPALAVLFVLFWSLQHLLERLDGMAQIIWNLTVIFSMLGSFVFGSMLGSIVGWRVAARVARGAPMMQSLAASRSIRAVSKRIPMVGAIVERALPDRSRRRS